VLSSHGHIYNSPLQYVGRELSFLCPIRTVTFKVSFSLLVINNTKTCYYNDVVCIADISSGLKILIYCFNSSETRDAITVCFSTLISIL